MNFDDQFGLTQLFGQHFVGPLKRLQFQVAGVLLAAAGTSAFPATQVALDTLLSPNAKVRRVEPLATQQSPNLPGAVGSIGSVQNRLFVLGREPPPGRFGGHLRRFFQAFFHFFRHLCHPGPLH